MATWTTISNAAVAVGGIPSSTTVTALRDNPVAIAEAATGAPIDVNNWHPVDKVTVGDGKTGIIYDGAVNGTVTNIITPVFEDGWEYKLICVGLTPSAFATFFLYVQWQGETTWDSVFSTGAASGNAGLETEFNVPRLAKNWHGNFALVTRANSVSDTSRWVAYNATAKKLYRAKIEFTNTNTTGGKVYLLRRRDYASLA